MNVKKGDLAIVVNCIEFPENIGILCEVEEWGGVKHFSVGRVENCWAVTSLGRAFRVQNGRAHQYKVWINDSCLRPIRGEPSEENLCEESPLATEC